MGVRNGRAHAHNLVRPRAYETPVLRARWIIPLLALGCGCPAEVASTPTNAVETAPEPDGPAGAPAATVVAGWPPELPPPPGVELERPAQGPHDVIGFAVQRPLAAAWERWSADLGEGGFRIDRLTKTDWSIAATLCTRDCAGSDRYALELRSFCQEASRGTVSRAIDRTRVDLPGSCVAVPQREFTIIEHRSGHGFDDYQGVEIDVESDYRWAFAARHALDLDRDGYFDVMVPVAAAPSTCPTEIQWELWITRGDCGHHVGQIIGDPAHVWRPKPVRLVNGMISLQTTKNPTGPDEPEIGLVYEFDGAVYREVHRDVPEARCDVHPADCQPMVSSSCRLEPHSP